jgi:hypothetical protein
MPPVTVERAFSSLIGEIEWGEMIKRGLIWCLPHGSTSRCEILPVQARRSSVPRRSPSWTSGCEGLETRGCSCKCQWDMRIVPWLLFQLFKPWGHFCKTSSVGARGRAYACWWADFGQFRSRSVHAFSFFFSVSVKEFLENCRKMLKIPDQFC